MAAGDFTVDGNSLQVVGTRWQIQGTAEVDGTKRAFDILPGRTILDFKIYGVDDAVSVEVDINQDASANSDNGNVALESDVAGVNTCNWTAQYV